MEVNKEKRNNSKIDFANNIFILKFAFKKRVNVCLTWIKTTKCFLNMHIQL